MSSDVKFRRLRDELFFANRKKLKHQNDKLDILKKPWEIMGDMDCDVILVTEQKACADEIASKKAFFSSLWDAHRRGELSIKEIIMLTDAFRDDPLGILA